MQAGAVVVSSDLDPVPEEMGFPGGLQTTNGHLSLSSLGGQPGVSAIIAPWWATNTMDSNVSKSYPPPLPPCL